MKKNTKILLGLGAIAAVAVAYHLYKQKQERSEVAAAKSKELAAAVKPSTATQGIVAGEPLNFKGNKSRKQVSSPAPYGSGKGKGAKVRAASIASKSAWK